MSAVAANQYVFSSTVRKNTLCIELDNQNLLSLQQCRKGFNRQVFDVSGQVILSSGYCVAPVKLDTVVGYAAVDKLPCTRKPWVSRVTLIDKSDARLSIIMPDHIGSLRLDEKCFDVKTRDRKGYIGLSECSHGNGDQQWYFQWGQIRNIATGKCLDAPDSVSSPSHVVVDLKLSNCNVERRLLSSQLWFNDNGVLKSGVSLNCVRFRDGKLVLGTHSCSSDDILAASSNYIQGLHELTKRRSSTSCSPNSVVTRKEIRDLTPKERGEYVWALQKLQKIPSLLAMGTQWYHSSALFLVWHRMFLAEMEHDLQKILRSPRFALPYWSWGTDSLDWFALHSKIFTPEFFGTSGVRNNGFCVTDGFIKDWVASDGPCVTRHFDADLKPSLHVNNPKLLYTDQLLLTIVQYNPITTKSYESTDEFRSIFEKIHNNVHGAIGGYTKINDKFVLGHMRNVSISVNDPVFFLHHSNVERYFTYFQKFNPNLKYAGTKRLPFNKTGEADLDTLLPGFNNRVRDVWAVETGEICYSYVPYSKSVIGIESVPPPIINLREDEISRRDLKSWFNQTFLYSFSKKVAIKFQKMRNVFAPWSVSKNNTENSQEHFKPNASVISQRRVQNVPSVDELLYREMNMENEIPKAYALNHANQKLQQLLNFETRRILRIYYNKTLESATLQEYSTAAKIAIAGITSREVTR